MAAEDKVARMQSDANQSDIDQLESRLWWISREMHVIAIAQTFATLRAFGVSKETILELLKMVIPIL
jgi:hypothetical protein